MKKEIVTEARSIGQNNNILRHLDMLKSRWNEEKDYEDFNDYVKSMKSLLEQEGYVLKNMNKFFHITLLGKFATYVLKMQGVRVSVSLAK